MQNKDPVEKMKNKKRQKGKEGMSKRNHKWYACFAALALIACQFIVGSSDVMAEKSGFQNILIVVDAGHTTGYNVGCVSGYNEGDWAYRQMLLDAEAYRAAGFTVITTREANENPGLVARGQMAVQNAAGYRDVVFISNHSNATPDRSTKASGVSACSSQYLSQKNTDLIDQMMSAVAQVMNSGTGVTYVRSIDSKPLNATGVDWYGVIRGAVNGAANAEQAAQGPVQYAFILEHGFHTNPAECSFLMNEDNCRLLAKAKAIVLTRYFGDLYGIPYTAEEIPTVPAAEVPTTPTETTSPVETTAPAAASTTETTAPGQDYSGVPIITNAEDTNNFWSAVVQVEDDGLNVRSEANSFTNNIIAKLPSGTKVIVTGEAVSGYGDVWFQVIAPGNIQGFVHGRYLIPKYYTSRNVKPSQENTTVYSLPKTTASPLAAYAAISSQDTIVTLNEVRQPDGWWSIVKINDCYVGFVPSKLLRDR